MIGQIRLVRNVGRFLNVTAANAPFRPLTLIYAENGRGKRRASVETNNYEANRDRHSPDRSEDQVALKLFIMAF